MYFFANLLLVSMFKRSCTANLKSNYRKNQRETEVGFLNILDGQCRPRVNYAQTNSTKPCSDYDNVKN